MTQPTDFFTLPDNLPVPVDDGAADHLVGMSLPDVALSATTGEAVNPSRFPGWVVIYCYPMTGRPGVALPQGWDDIPGARGCTPQTCAFRDHYQELRDLGANVLGLSTQTTDYQREMVERLDVPFPVLSDADFQLTAALRLPTFEVEGMRLLKRLTLIARDGQIMKVNYPVFPSFEDPDRAIAWLRTQA
jgi:peroxiredoxin